MKQLKKSFLSVVIVGILTASCSQVVPTAKTIKNQKAANDTIHTNEKLTYSMVVPDRKNVENSIQKIGYSFASNELPYNYQVANNNRFFENNLKNPTSLIPILACLLLTLSTFKIYLNNIDDDSVWMESELKRIRKIKK